MNFIDISVKGSVGSLTKQVKPMGLSTAIILKVPAWDLTSVRVSGDRATLEQFINGYFEPRAAVMHIGAIKTALLATDAAVVPAKNRALMEYRNA